MNYSLTLIVSILLIAAPALYGETKAITVGVADTNYYPHHDFENNQTRGYIYDVLALFQAASDYHVVYVPLPIKRLKNRFFHKKDIDLYYPYNPNWHKPTEPKLEIHYSAPVVSILGGTMVLKENLGKGLKHFHALSVPRGFTPIEWYKIQHEHKVNIVEVSNASDALRMVLKKRVDGADVEFNVAQHLLKKLGYRDKLALDPELPLSIVDFHLVTLKQKQFIAEFNAFIIENPTLIRSLKRKYGLRESLDDLGYLLSKNAPNQVNNR
mgnify:CR=1 FL=1